MIARVDREIVEPDSLWWPAMNYNQFRWDYPLGIYDLELPRDIFLERLFPAYLECVAELRADDLIDPNQESPLKAADYPPLELLLGNPEALFEVMTVYLWEDLFAAFLKCPVDGGRFMVNSIDEIVADSFVVRVRGRGYHAVPGLR